MPDRRDPRIVSLVPSATEMVGALGASEFLVGRSHVCDFPSEARSLPALTSPQLVSETSRGIHDEVRQRLSAGLAIYALDLETLRDLEPTHLLVQDQCSVCAIARSDLEVALGDWLEHPPQLISLAPHQLVDVWQDIDTIGRAIGRRAEAGLLRAQLAERLSELVESRRNPEGRRPLRVACIEWLEPLMIAGHWVPELIRIAGGEPVLSTTGGPSRTVTPDELIDAAPDLLVLQLCGFDEAVSREAWWAASPLRDTLRSGLGSDWPLFVSDGSVYFNRPGPRLVDSAERLARTIRMTEDPGAATNEKTRTAPSAEAFARLPFERPSTGHVGAALPDDSRSSGTGPGHR